MKDILLPPNREVLDEFAWSNVLLAFDYDGTLAPIVADPGRAPMRPPTRRLLHRLAGLYPCVVISGRGLADTTRWLAGTRLRSVVGNHGAEPGRPSRRLREAVKRWRPRLERRLSGLPGVWIEDKVLSVAIHFRRSRQKRKARVAILRAVAHIGRVRVLGGKQVVNLLPPGAPHKGLALERERNRFRCDTAVYVGDDETDEDVFTMDEPGRLLTIRVGRRRGSAASYFVRNQAAVDRLLTALIRCRQRKTPYR